MNNKLNRILLSPDEATGAVEVDPLSGAAAGVDTSFPLLAAERIVRFKLARCSIEKGKANENTETLTLKFRTEKEATLQDGKTTHAGFPVTKWIGLTPTKGENGKEPYTVDSIRRECALFLKAIGQADKDLSELRRNPSQFEGVVVDCKVGIRPGKGSYPDSNSLTLMLPA